MTKIRLWIAYALVTAFVGCSKPAPESQGQSRDSQVEERLTKLESEVAELQKTAGELRAAAPAMLAPSPQVTVDCDAFVGDWNSVEFTMSIRKSGEQFVAQVASDEAPQAALVGTHVARCENGALQLPGGVATLASDGNSLQYYNAVYRRR
jgi:hypothetical protein